MALGGPQRPGPSLDRSLSKSGVVYATVGSNPTLSAKSGNGTSPT